MDKQIEEMAKEICSEYDCVIPCQSCAYYGYENCRDVKSAEKLYTAGYRKSEEVAREIFEEIDKRFEALLKFYPCNGEFEDAKRFVDFHWKHIRHSILCDYDAELKKKCAEDN